MKTFTLNKLLATVIFATALHGTSNLAEAGIIQTSTGFEVDYRLNLHTSTATGNDIQSVAIFEWNDAGDFNIDQPYTIAGSGYTQLTHTIDFLPTSAMVLGYLDSVAGVGDEKRHLYMLANWGFDDNLSGQKFSEIFGVGEQDTIDLLLGIESNDAAAITAMTSRVQNEFASAVFDPAGDFQVLKWSVGEPPVGASVPEPGVVSLLLLGLAGLLTSRNGIDKLIS